MPQISPMNWMMTFSLFIFIMLFLTKALIYEKTLFFKKKKVMIYVK